MNVLSLDIDGFNLQNDDFDFIVLGLFEGEREIKSNELLSDGLDYYYGKNKEKKLLLKGQIKNNILANLFKLKQVLFKKGLKKVNITIDSMQFYVNVDLENWVCDEFNPEFIACQLVAPDPYLYSINNQIISLGATSNNGLVFPMTFPISFGNLTGGIGTISNVGNAVAYPVITVIGSCSNLVITNVTTGESMSLNVNLGSTDTLIIDNRPKTRSITLNGINRIDLKQGDWLSCTIGDNQFSFSRNSIELKQHCTIDLKPRWI